MTATLARPERRTSETRVYLRCPCCDTPTARVVYMGWYGTDLQLLATASGPDDGARCKTHARTEAQRRAESLWALRHALKRPVYVRGEGFVLLDDIAASTE